MNTWELVGKLIIMGLSVGLTGWIVGSIVNETFSRHKERLTGNCSRCGKYKSSGESPK